MPARIIDGKAVAEALRVKLAERVGELAKRGVHPCLAAVTVRRDPAWAVYLKNQAAACAALGIKHQVVAMADGCTAGQLSERIEGLNVDPLVHGIIVQNPLPDGFSNLAVQAQLSPDKDVEGVNPANLGLVLAGRGNLAPCTAQAAVVLAREAIPDLRGVEAVVVGASTIVGKPIAQLLLAAGATVTTCHIDTRDLARHTRHADLLIVAVGKAGLITAKLVKPGAVVIDVGINRIPGPGGKSEIVGDVAAEVAQVASALTPVPGGVGALTTTILMEATIAAAARLADERPAIDGAALSRLLGGAALKPEVADRVATLLSRHLIHAPGQAPLASSVERRLGQGVWVLDGAMGTELIARGVAPAATAEANFDRPELVQEVHRAYLAAGAEALTTNTFLANRYRCGGDRERAVRLAASGVRLAREIAHGDPRRPLVLGSIGPLGPVVGVDVVVAEAEDAFAEVALAMADAGVDGFALETMSSTAETAAALAGIKRVSRLPTLASRSFERDDPRELAEFARACEAGGAAAVGINCAAGPRALVPIVARLAGLTKLPVLVRPNAGFPTKHKGRSEYRLRPAYLVEQAKAYIAAGAGIVGGCCGVGPSHIAALAELKGKPLAARTGAVAVAESHEAEPAARHDLLRAAAAGGFPVLAFVPGKLSAADSNLALGRLAVAGADAVGLLAGWPGPRRGARLPARLRHLQDASHKPAVLELIAGDIGLADAQDLLLGAHLLGIRLVLIDSGVFASDTRGDDQRHGCDPVELLAAIKRLNRGRDLAGSRLDEPTAFTVGVRIAAAAMDRLGRFVDAGADFLTLQPVYEPKRFRAFMEHARVPVPVFAEVLLLPDAATADEIDNELPALSVPERLKQRLAADPDDDVKGVLAFLASWRSRLAGVCLLLPDERTLAAEKVLAAIKK